MRTLILLAAIATLVAGGSASADTMSSSQRESAKSDAASAFAKFSRNAPAAVMSFLVSKNPQVFQSIDRSNADTCLSNQAPAARVDDACQAALRQFIATIRSLLSTSYGLTRSMGRFDPTTVSYSKELTRRLLMLDPQRKI